MSKRTKSPLSFDPSVKFMHLRYQDHQKNVLATGGTTIAYRQTDAGIQYAVSKCHHRDNYVKQLGRIKAHGRLASKSAKTFVGDEQAFLDNVEEGYKTWNAHEQVQVQLQGLPAEYAVQMFRKFNGRRKPAAKTVIENGVEG